jgi:2-polyprenyl-3-methyl-5-hydroxy-6-metoxy-1,4-benzoquinol methylase
MPSITGILRRFGRWGRKAAWNREFRKEAHFVGERSELLLKIIKDTCEGKRIVELACGDGSLARAIQSFGWLSYDGYDISSVAIEQARVCSTPEMKFHLQDMEGWAPLHNFDVLIIEEAIYYLSPKAQIDLISRAFKGMGPTGLIIIAMHSRKKFNRVIARLRSAFKVQAEHNEGDRCYLLLSTPS